MNGRRIDREASRNLESKFEKEGRMNEPENGDPRLTLPFTAIDRGALAVAGGKAANLGELVRAEFPVPAGFCVTTAAYELVAANAGQVAAVILEPIPGNMGVVPPDPEFLRGLRALCDREGIVLIFDEVISGFRASAGGAQAVFDVRPDMTCLGKIIGGGLPVGAYGGREALMRIVAPDGPVYQRSVVPNSMRRPSASILIWAVTELPASLSVTSKVSSPAALHVTAGSSSMEGAIKQASLR